jgi:hypothetical protein
MRWLSFFLICLFFSGAAISSQDSSPPQQQQEQRPTLGKEPEQQRPTLGTAPSLNGPLTATIMDARKLRRVRTVYIGMMDNQLNLRLSEDLSKHGPFRVVDNRNSADAILQGTCFDSLHLREVHSEVFLTGRDGKAIWQDIIHEPYHPPSLAKAVDNTAEKIVLHLQESIGQAGRR